MKKIYIQLGFLILLLAILSSLLLIEIPSPSKTVSEQYTLEIQ